MQLLSILLLVFPLAGFLISGLLQSKLKGTTAGLVSSSAVLINFILSVVLFLHVQNTGIPVVTSLFDWIRFSDISINFQITVDQLSALMLLIVNGVGMLIHFYSIGYMHGDAGFNRFFAYLNLFIFFMLTLILGSNYLMVFIGWEGVGLSSYLLIGFWYKDHENNNAANKAFIMNRIGDLGFLVGLFLTYTKFHTLDIQQIAAQAATLQSGDTSLMWITICLFIGAVGKSAQIPLFTWLPDAMAGPTPVSALIHAATMVTAGVYLVVRSNVMFVLSPVTMEIIFIAGAATALIGSLIAIYQWDIKKVLAYSTVSQLGFLFMALGVGSFNGAMFHLTTHAFFKALLFLAAGSVIHALGGEQDIRNMGGLRKKIPFTFALFIIGTIAISGIPPFAGFFSKEMILTAAFEYNTYVGLFSAFISLLTTIYMFRLLYLVFYKPASEAVKSNHHVHESPAVMLVPMSVLAVLSVIGGWIQFPELFGDVKLFTGYLEPVFAQANALVHEGTHTVLSHEAEWMLFGIPVAIIALLILISYKRFVNDKALTEAGNIAVIPARKFYFDEIYDFLFVKPTEKLSVFTREILDQAVINRFINAIGNSTVFLGKNLRLLQTGNIGFYMLIMVLSIIAILFFNVII